MATLAFDVSDGACFNPISSQLATLPNGAGTMAALFQAAGGTPGDICGLTDGSGTLHGAVNWYHTLAYNATTAGGVANSLFDDDGLVGISAPSTITLSTNWWLAVVSWGAGTGVERFSWTNIASIAWTHSNSSGNNGGTRAGPTTTAGQFNLAFLGDQTSNLNLALVAAWAGVQLSDAQVEALASNLKTSDWYNNAAGTPTLLVECTTITPTDIGAHPSTFKTQSGATATGGNPTGWTFDGQGSGGGGVALAGAGVSTSAGVGTLTAAVTLAGAGKSTTSGVGTLSVTTPVALAGAGQSTTSGVGTLFVVTPSFQGAGTSTTSGVGTLSAPIATPLAGAGSSTSKGIGTLTVGVPLAGAGASTTSGSGTFKAVVPLAGAGTSTTAGVGTLSENQTMSGAGKSTTSGVGTLTVRVSLTGAGKSTTQGHGQLTNGSAILPDVWVPTTLVMKGDVTPVATMKGETPAATMQGKTLTLELKNETPAAELQPRTTTAVMSGGE